ncbi:phosphoglycerate mutase-like protein [Trametes versicolor FP-101664 SS1]|uniref:phosphoglycerate mutase-like protein n=1 Tax=Trametes versicolor (strain FP-101664) TaxID=717944 RepID=UPI0004622FFE|nr:phosphoglycerate mutase-like protein [Trametes versicolor FP-101664 SS1]EIW55519.1 phosphoglycerate mutase-like protein [Trametes versicolor FP-101664 SS1]
MGLSGNEHGRNVVARGHVPLDVEGYPAAPPELELQQVHIYVRHGERTPVGVRMADPPANIPEHWMFCNTARQFRAAVSSATAEEGQNLLFPAVQTGPAAEELRARRVVERRDGSTAVGECLLGELTDVGRESTYNFGSSLRKLYVDKLKFLPDVVNSNDELYLRSTNMPRTIESLQQITHGLYPMTKHAKDFVPLLRIRNGKDENLFGNTMACKRLEVLQIGFAHAAAAAWNTTLEPLDKKLSKFIGGNPVRLDGKPRASGILDTVRAADAHGVKVPSEFKEAGVLDVIEKAVVHEWFAGYRTEEVRRLGMGPLLSDLAQKMQAKAENSDANVAKILIHSTHDTCLAGLSNTLDIFDERWPAFTAAVTFELFKKHTPAVQPASAWQNVLSMFGRDREPTEHYVRVRYQNQDKALPFCAQEGKHLPGSPEFCTLAAFRERVLELTPTNWEAECAYTPVNKLKEREEIQAAAALVIAKP